MHPDKPLVRTIRLFVFGADETADFVLIISRGQDKRLLTIRVLIDIRLIFPGTRQRRVERKTPSSSARTNPNQTYDRAAAGKPDTSRAEKKRKKKKKIYEKN